MYWRENDMEKQGIRATHKYTRVMTYNVHFREACGTWKNGANDENKFSVISCD